MSDKFTVRFEKEDDQWLAFDVDYPNISAYGDTPSEALIELDIVRALFAASYRKRGEKVPWEVECDNKRSR